MPRPNPTVEAFLASLQHPQRRVVMQQTLDRGVLDFEDVNVVKAKSKLVALVCA